MKKCTIKIEPGNDTQDVTVKYNDMKSHSISASRMADVLKASKAATGQGKAVETGWELFSVLDGSGGWLRSEMDKADETGEVLALYLDLPPVYDGLPFELLLTTGFCCRMKICICFAWRIRKSGNIKLNRVPCVFCSWPVRLKGRPH
ncbi:hypothetical protein QUF90_08655 [Desulfococcaceae bacterium HSG9]|nr:hypothetical protein [Desulfococcaceae bacterium HSG9]